MQHLYPRLLCQHSTWLKHQTVNQPEPKYILTEYLTRILDVSWRAPSHPPNRQPFNRRLIFQMRFSYQFRRRDWRMVMQTYPHILASNLTQELVSWTDTSDECAFVSICSIGFPFELEINYRLLCFCCQFYLALYMSVLFLLYLWLCTS